MKQKKFLNILHDLDFQILNNPEFQEDSVREEIILPIIRELGYGTSKPHQIIRSRKLLHPYVSIGSKKKNIYIIPDYLFEVDGKPAWILDAKGPNEKIINSRNVEQAYSYAIHSEVRVNYFALCNGREFALYHIGRIQPILHFNITELGKYWDSLMKFIGPNNVFQNSPFKLAKDLGLHLKRLGFDKSESLIFHEIPVTEIGQLDPDMFSFSGGLKLDDQSYVVTWDFDQSAFAQLRGKIPEDAYSTLKERDNQSRKVVRFNDVAYLINVDCRIGEDLQENENEIFLPMLINRII
ncbi:putative type IV restriction endonuclease [Owenweeksia hongkongensis DSM 17368]|uniref:Putative type IV restriction endonuclease n=1 Tax=Owenweeksia hongkongensis (strain DSM 17368 / CIP 108786 / JCM 12287 / NRRL B-23963 / UST20020801) TaxID=926562 RepID=G8R1M6_OWEHD|nr:type I restriction enzyme HsdR N-terminal domain-containing protein [Owenweeksia hongkongensis]AEV31765.1 putative type IV restriction endonuclease [Owenweeksia hongkongensis DSM 17368]